jgi:ketopantoate hydroxymethyltransferase
MLKWLTGKKTYIGAVALALAAIAGFWFGAVDAEQLTALLSIAAIAVGLGHKGDRQVALLVEALGKANAEQEKKQSPGANGAK